MGYDLAAAVGLVLAVAMTVTVVRTVRAVRRLRRRAAAVLAMVCRGEIAGADAGWWVDQRTRRRMWRSVAAADRAVASARTAGVPIGDLASVVRQLRSAAGTVDAGFASTRSSREVHDQALALAAAADEVARAAGAAVARDTASLTARVVEAVRLELAALR